VTLNSTNPAESLSFLSMAREDWALLVRQADGGEPDAKERLFTGLYAELHRLAERQLRVNSSVAISPTTLLHETYLSLAHGHAVFPDRDRFLGYAARAMRNLIVDFARAHRAQRRGGQFYITRLDTSVDEQAHAADCGDPAVEALAGALDELAVRDRRLAEVVDLKYFAGLSLLEIAALRGVSERTIQREWERARMLLQHMLKGDLD
jgi:RNA polymerase sigma factor (TIGR02999 family)